MPLRFSRLPMAAMPIMAQRQERWQTAVPKALLPMYSLGLSVSLSQPRLMVAMVEFRMPASMAVHQGGNTVGMAVI